MVLAHRATAVDFDSSANSSGWDILTHLPTAVVGIF